MNSIKIGIVGCGAAAQGYYLPLLKNFPYISQNTHLVDKNILNAKKMAKELNSPHVYDDYHEILNKVDGVIIAVPHSLHHSITIDFLNNGVHVLCEKPLSDGYSKAQEMVQAAQKNQRKLCVNNTRRLFPSFLKVKELIEKGTIGDLISIDYFEANKFEWESETAFYFDHQEFPKGVLLDLGSHVLDLICWWIGGKPQLISYEDDSFGGPESYAHVMAKYNDIDIEVRINRLLDVDDGFIFQGNYGKLEGKLMEWKNLKFVTDDSKEKNIYIKSEYRAFHDMVKKLVLNFIEVVNQNEEPLVTGAEVLDSIRLIEECYDNRKRFQLPWYQNLENLINE